MYDFGGAEHTCPPCRVIVEYQNTWHGRCAIRITYGTLLDGRTSGHYCRPNGGYTEAMKITKALTRLTGPETAPVFVLLHGWGSNEYDLPDLLNYCGAGSADYASLQAPIAYGMGYTWFGAWAHEGVPEGESLDKQATEAAQAIDAWVAEHIPATRPMVAMGFSQGGLLAAHLLRCNPQRYAAAVSCSGWLAPGPVSGDAELAALKPPVFYGHGAADDIFPKADVTAMGEFWHEHGTLTEQVYPGMAHSINMPEMRDIQRFLETNGFIRPQIW